MTPQEIHYGIIRALVSRGLHYQSPQLFEKLYEASVFSELLGFGEGGSDTFPKAFDSEADFLAFFAKITDLLKEKNFRNFMIHNNILDMVSRKAHLFGLFNSLTLAIHHLKHRN